MVVIPESEKSLARFFGPVHNQYAVKLNASHGWTGHLWQQRFYSVPMDERHTLAAMRYVELNPVRAGLCSAAQQWRWSSATANLGMTLDDLVDTKATHALVSDWSAYLAEATVAEEQDALRKHTRIGRPLGNAQFIDMLEIQTGRTLRARKTGPPRRS
jgi:putative transposase